MSDFTERALVEDYIVEKLQEKGWKFVPAEDLERESLDEPRLILPLMRGLKRINQHSGIGDEEIQRALSELKLAGAGQEGAKRILNFYKFGISMKFEKERVVKFVQLFDYKDIANNEFIVSRQVWHYGREPIRNDILLYINGIPLVNIECKSPVSMTETWYHACRQIQDYQEKVPELYKYVQIGIAAEAKARYFPIVPWQDDVRTEEWKNGRGDPLGRPEKVDLSNRPYNSIDSMIEMLSTDILLDIIHHFLFFRIERGEATKIITRYMQYRAANKMVSRVVGNLRGEEEKNRGLIWHWQGSGKTLTMVFAANKLYYHEELGNPSIFFIVDRIELEDQLHKEFYSLDIVKPEIIQTAEELKNVLVHDDYRGKRGVFITLIHKFRPEELGALQKELEEVSGQKETIMTRRNVIAFVDEGHRTQYGILAAQMKAILKNAFFFALTGTPISKRGRDTFLEFSYPPAEVYLDRYFITDSIKDGFTVKIVYQPRLEDEVHLKKEMLEAFWEAEMEELPEEIREEVEEKVKRSLNAIRVVLENPERIRMIAKDIVKHFQENVDGRFKAMVAACSRKACVLYKNALDQLLPEECSEVIMTYTTAEEEPVIQEYVSKTVEKYGRRDAEEIRKSVIEKFKEEEYPKILIVTDMLLTGFDAPILQTMYLDKPLREHRLLQAVARTNRPYKDVKEAGLVIDYAGVLKQLHKALEMYSEEDIQGALCDYDAIRQDFITTIQGILHLLKEVPRDYERESLLKAVEILTSEEEKGKEFVNAYKRLRKIFELLGPDEVKLEHFEDYKWISAIYVHYIKTVLQKPEESAYERYYAKTLRYIHKSTEIENLETRLPSLELGVEALTAIEEKVKSREEKAASMLFILHRLVLVEKRNNPIYESLVDKVERLLKLWKEKTKNYKAIYDEATGIFQEIRALTERQQELGLSNLEYSWLLDLEKKFGRYEIFKDDVKLLLERVREYMFPGWWNQATAKQAVKSKIREFVRKYKVQYRLPMKEMEELYHNLSEKLDSYGMGEHTV